MNEQVHCEFLIFVQKGRAGRKFPHHMAALKIFGTLTTPTTTIIWPNLKSVPLPVPELIGIAKNWSGPWLCPHSLSPQKILYASIQTIWLWALFPRFSIAVLSGRCEPPILGKGRGGRKGSGWLPLEWALVSCYRPSIVNVSSIFTRFRDIGAFVLQHATFPYPTSIVSPKFSHVPWE